LWWSPDNVWPYTKIATAVTGTDAAAGYIVPAVIATTGPETPEGANGWFFVRAEIISDHWWSGQTLSFLNPTGAPNAQPPTPPSSLDGWTTAITLVWIPEPSTWVLAGLGVTAMVLFRRRK